MAKLLEEALLDKDAAEAFLGVSVRTIDRERSTGKLKWVKVRGRVLFRVEDLHAYIARGTQGDRN